MIRVVALIATILMAVAVPGFAVADEAKVCRTGHEAYSPARPPQVVGWAADTGTAVWRRDGAQVGHQLGVGFNLFIISLADHAAEAGFCVAPGPERAARFYAEGVARGDWGSMLQLAVMTANGDGGAADPVRAVALFRRGLLRYFAPGNGNWDLALRYQQLSSLPPVLAAQHGWADEAIKVPSHDALAFAGEFLDPDGPAWDPFAACLYLDKQSWVAPEVAFALHRIMLDQPGRLPAPPGAADVWLSRSAGGRYGPALAEIGRRQIVSERPLDRFDAITYLAAARKAGENVDDLLQKAARGQPEFVVGLALRDLDHYSFGVPSILDRDPNLTLNPCSPPLVTR